MKDNKRQVVRVVDNDINWEGLTIPEIRKDLDRLEKLGASYIDIEVDSDYGVGSITIYAMKDDIETDEEFFNRISLDKKREDTRKQIELKMLEKLKAKYES